MIEAEAIVGPDGIGDDVRRESVAFVSFYPAILAIVAGLLVSTFWRGTLGTSCLQVVSIG